MLNLVWHRVQNLSTHDAYQKQDEVETKLIQTEELNNAIKVSKD